MIRVEAVEALENIYRVSFPDGTTFTVTYREGAQSVGASLRLPPHGAHYLTQQYAGSGTHPVAVIVRAIAALRASAPRPGPT